MAIWQYQFHMVPQEELNSYFKDKDLISYEDLSEIKWWKYRQLDITSFDNFGHLLPRKKSWSKDIILFGSEESSCIEIFLEGNDIIEISVRVDLRLNYTNFINLICDYALNHRCMFLNNKLEILYPSLVVLENDILSYPTYKMFLDKFKK
ncbi:hypothetical protein DM790_01965 [Flavobacterium collinsii]|nr:hypothetical protein [Flavobacterium collinsii]